MLEIVKQNFPQIIYSYIYFTEITQSFYHLRLTDCRVLWKRLAFQKHRQKPLQFLPRDLLIAQMLNKQEFSCVPPKKIQLRSSHIERFWRSSNRIISTNLSIGKSNWIETGLFRCWFNPAVTLAAVVRCFLSTMRFNARRSLSVSLEIRLELLRLLKVFSCFMNSFMVLDLGSSRKIKQFSYFGDRLLSYEIQQIFISQTQLGHVF